MLNVNYLGFELENPCILASASPTSTVEKIEKAFQLGWGGAVIKTVVPAHIKVEDVSNRFHVLKDKNRVIGFENLEQLSTKSIAYWQEGIAYLKSKYPTKMLILSVMANVEKSSWQELIKAFNETQIDAFELNFSCPHMRREEGMGASIGQDSKVSSQIVSWVKEVSNKPIIVKLTPNITSIDSVVQEGLKSGADSYSAINTVAGLIGVDIHLLTPYPNVSGASSSGGYSGQAIRPIGLRIVAELSRLTDKEIVGIGGISTWENVIEYIAVGATAIQICTEVMMSGMEIIKPILHGLSAYMNEKGLISLEEIRGVASKKMGTQESLSREWHPKSRCIQALCIKCKKCIVACFENSQNAISFENGEIKIDRDKCNGCSLCTHICPSKALILE